MGKGQKTGDSNLNITYMKITGLMHEKGEKIHIQQTESRDGKYVKLDETVQWVSGDLQKAEVREYSPRAGETAQELKVWLKDEKAGELYIVSCGMNIIGRSILNTILSLEAPYGELLILVYNKKKDGKPAASIKHNGAKVGWKFSLEEQAKYVTVNEIKKGGTTKVERDYWELNQFLAGELKKIFVEQPTPDTPIESAPVDVLMPDGIDDDDDLPDFLKGI